MYTTFSNKWTLAQGDESELPVPRCCQTIIRMRKGGYLGKSSTVTEKTWKLSQGIRKWGLTGQMTKFYIQIILSNCTIYENHDKGCFSVPQVLCTLIFLMGKTQMIKLFEHNTCHNGNKEKKSQILNCIFRNTCLWGLFKLKVNAFGKRRPTVTIWLKVCTFIIAIMNFLIL